MSNEDELLSERRDREHHRMLRRWLLLVSILAGLILVPLVLLAARFNRERQAQRQEDARQRAIDDHERQPGAPEYLVAVNRTPHDGFRAYNDVEDDAKYRGKVFRVVGKASSFRLVPGLARAELDIRDGDDTATFHLHIVTSAARLEALQREGGLLEPPACDGADAEFVIVDGTFESRTLFTHCYVRWKGKGDDWPSALREAKKELNLNTINRH